jgi:acetyltransferase-like isoleucine patch superfamily enzyme
MKKETRIILSWIRKYPLRGILSLIKSIYYSYVLLGCWQGLKVLIAPGMKLNVSRENKSVIDINGLLIFNSWMGKTGSVFIKLDDHSLFKANDDVYIGPGVHVYLKKEAELVFFNSNEHITTITSDCKILVSKKVEIGHGTIIGWSTTITDSDWHTINSSNNQSSVFIGERCWIGSHTTILKGSKILEGSVIGSCSLVNKNLSEKSTLYVGCPVKGVVNDIEWQY